MDEARAGPRTGPLAAQVVKGIRLDEVVDQSMRQASGSLARGRGHLCLLVAFALSGFLAQFECEGQPLDLRRS